MEQDAGTLNGSGVNQEVGSIVSTDSPIFNPDTTNTFHDLDDVPDVVATPAPGAKPAVVEKGNGEDKSDERFDKHPRFIQLMKERDDARLAAARLEGRIEGTAPKQPAPRTEPLPFKDTSKMTADQLREWRDDDPKGYDDNLRAQARWEAATAIREELSLKEKRDKEHNDLKSTYEKFEAKHKDFKAMWESGEVIKFIDENPGHNPISAYYEMIGDQAKADAEKTTAEAVEKAKKEAADEVTKRFLAKKKATVLSGGPAGPTRAEDDPALSNTKEHGGRTAVIAEKLAAMRRASGR